MTSQISSSACLATSLAWTLQFASGQPADAEKPPHSLETIFRQPEIDARSVEACVIGEVHPASERFYVRLGNVGKGTAMKAQTWDAGRYTGLRVTPGELPSACQRGPLPSGEGTTVQIRGREIGIWNTQLPILFSALNHRSQWLHPGPSSSLFSEYTFDEYRAIDVRVGPSELRAAIIAMRKALPKFATASEDPRDYQLVHFNLNPEVSAPVGTRGQLGLSLRDIHVELLGW